MGVDVLCNDLHNQHKVSLGMELVFLSRICRRVVQEFSIKAES